MPRERMWGMGDKLEFYCHFQPPCSTKAYQSVLCTHYLRTWLCWFIFVIKCRPFDKKVNTFILCWYESRFVFRATTHLVLAELSWQPGSFSGFLSALYWLSQILSLGDGDTWSSGWRVMSLTLPQWEGVDSWLESVSWFNSFTLIVESLLISGKKYS